MKKYLLIILLSLSSSIYGQDISVETQKYCVSVKELEVDTLCNLVYTVKNGSSTPQVLLFTEDDVNSMPLKTLIKRKLMRRYGDFNIAFFMWDANITKDSSGYVQVPEIFIKILSPDESFNITLSFQNEDDHRVDSLFRKHLLICNLEDIEGDERFSRFKWAINTYHLEYPYSSITLLWDQFTHWLNKQNSQNSQDSENQLYDLIIESMKSSIDWDKQFYQKRGVDVSGKKTIIYNDNFPNDFLFEETEKELGVVFFEKSLFSKSELKKGICVKRLGSIKVNNDTISITILDHFLQIRKKHMSFAVGEGMTCKYIFNHHTKQWEKSECKKWGL